MIRFVSTATRTHVAVGVHRGTLALFGMEPPGVVPGDRWELWAPLCGAPLPYATVGAGGPLCATCAARVAGLAELVAP